MLAPPLPSPFHWTAVTAGEEEEEEEEDGLDHLRDGPTQDQSQCYNSRSEPSLLSLTCASGGNRGSHDNSSVPCLSPCGSLSRAASKNYPEHGAPSRSPSGSLPMLNQASDNSVLSPLSPSNCSVGGTARSPCSSRRGSRGPYQSVDAIADAGRH